MKSLQTTFERRLLGVCARIHQSLHQQHQQKLRRPWRSCDKETLWTKHSPLWYKITTGRKRHIQGDVLREGGLWMAWIQDFRWFQVSKGAQEPCTPGAGGCSRCSCRAAPAYGTGPAPALAWPLAHPPLRLPSPYPCGSGLCPQLHRAHEVIRRRLP